MPKPSRTILSSKRTRDELSTETAALVDSETSAERQAREQGDPARQPSRASQKNRPDYPARKQPETGETESHDRPSGESASLRAGGAHSKKPASRPAPR